MTVLEIESFRFRLRTLLKYQINGKFWRKVLSICSFEDSPLYFNIHNRTATEALGRALVVLKNLVIQANFRPTVDANDPHFLCLLSLKLELQRCQKNDVTISFVLKESSNEDWLDSYPIRMLSRKYKALKLAPYGVQMIVQNAASKRIDLL